jgi:iron complex transport system ATP-binding protein
MIEAREITVRRAGRMVLDRVSLSLGAGAFAVLAGPNGAGKSTLLAVLAGLLRADAGRVQAPAPLSSRIAWLAQRESSAWDMTAGELVALGRLPHGGADPDRRVAAALDACGIAALTSRRLSTMSGGEARRTLLARALAVGADVLLLDEPTAALDPAHAFAVLEILRREARAGRAVLAALHTPELALEHADRLLVLDQGRLVADGPPVATLPAAAAAYGLRLGHGPAMLPAASPP